MPAPNLKQYRLYAAMFLLNLAVVAGVIYLLTRDEPRPLIVTVPPAQATVRAVNAVSSPLPVRANPTVSAPVGNAPVPQKTGLPSATETPRRVNLNTATLDELNALPGIGPTLAQRIIDYRTSHNGFKSIDEVNQVRGIGEKLFAEIKERITVQ